MKVNLKKYNQDIRKEFLTQYSIYKGIDRSSFFTKDKIDVNLADYFKAKKILKTILNEGDLTFIVGYKYWYKDRFKLQKGVFVPQYDTEDILELVDSKYTTGLEVGVGTGVISISLAKHFNKQMTGIDINMKAINLADYNAMMNEVEIELKEKDIFDYMPKRKFDFLITNPPYIDKDEEVDDWVKKEQPEEALYADDHGLKFYKYLIDNYETFLRNNGAMYFEIGYNQKEELERYLSNKPFEYNFRKDISGNWRYMEVIFTNDN